ncbi:orf 24; similar to BCRF1 [Ateline gammaherpesvirus 3]|uniref:Similar to BCRF1 n=1 Tax=Ateline herpesvirus 3 TaxID=85618 RepID=Q9YTP2_ATHV3|nr:orf 24; similar to BCRF1 [Ateline gammaherpesvirus 3]AAC95548.1 orf 24; similar to BCRF1 [Ateline gammaherpesvirus 3]
MSIFFFPVLKIPAGGFSKCFQTNDGNFNMQLKIFCCLATNQVVSSLDLNGLDYIMGQESTFYTCRAVRRLLLGSDWYPFLGTLANGATGASGPTYDGPGLIINNTDSTYKLANICSNKYLPIVYSLETTDVPQEPLMYRALYFADLEKTPIDYMCMFRIICRYLTMAELEECYEYFLAMVGPPFVNTCKKNYLKLLSALKILPSTFLATPSHDNQLEYFKFSILSFLQEWSLNNLLNSTKKKIIAAVHSHPHLVIKLCTESVFKEIKITDANFIGIQQAVNHVMPNLHTEITKKDPGTRPLKVAVQLSDSTSWVIYPPSLPIYRAAMCLASVTAVSIDNKPVNKQNIGTASALVSTFNKINYAPKDKKNDMTLNSEVALDIFKNYSAQKCTEKNDFLTYQPIHRLGINNFKVNVFNTNMVINTKIFTHPGPWTYKSLMDIPRLTKNFVFKKYSVKEPAFTVSVFYCENMCQGAAVNINISGDLLTFLHAMGNMKCYLPIKNILPVSLANWNSTLDLHGLENQSVVRTGRRDVFWTTNFPSAVSTKLGFNVSWFKAATATISKIYGNCLASHITKEVSPIIFNNRARLNLLKNTLFAILESRNRSQIQTLHKRMLECLITVCSFLRLDSHAVRRLAQTGMFDFSKKTISHAKNKHDCALLGYKKCNMIPKILSFSKKIRLDEHGRNANFLAFIGTTGSHVPKIKAQLIRHVLRTLGLHWRSTCHRVYNAIE